MMQHDAAQVLSLDVSLDVNSTALTSNWHMTWRSLKSFRASECSENLAWWKRLQDPEHVSTNRPTVFSEKPEPFCRGTPCRLALFQPLARRGCFSRTAPLSQRWSKLFQGPCAWNDGFFLVTSAHISANLRGSNTIAAEAYVFVNGNFADVIYFWAVANSSTELDSHGPRCSREALSITHVDGT